MKAQTMAKTKKPVMGEAIKATADGPRVIPQSITVYGMKALRLYANEVNLDRATPDLKDGMKPVQRRIVYGAADNPKGVQVKSARVVGDVMGKYHPHGDGSIYGAMVTLVKSPTPLLAGTGNWGNLVDGPAAMRYTEATLTNFGRSGFDPNYAHREVTSFVPSYDGKEMEPVSIPFPLPVILFNGGEGIGYGTACSLPSFTPESVVAVLQELLAGTKLKPEDFAKMLKPVHRNGGNFVNSKNNRDAWLKMFTGTKASVLFEAPLKVDTVKKTLVIKDWPPGLDPTVFSEWLKTLDEVQEVYPSNGSQELTIVVKRAYNSVQFDAFVKLVQLKARKKVSYNINVTNREAVITDGVVDYTVDLMNLSIPQLVVAWLRARIVTEKRSLEYRIRKQAAAIAYSELMIFAAGKTDIIVKIVREAKDPRAELVKVLKVTAEQADQILEIRLRQLGRLDQADLHAKLKDQQRHAKELERWLKKPNAKISTDIGIAMETILADRKVAERKRNQKLVFGK